MRFFIVAACALMLTAGACGGSQRSYSVDATWKCLASEHYLPKPFRSPLISGTRGDIAIYFSGAGYPPGRVIVMFGKDHGEADDILARTKLIGKATGESHLLFDEIGNVVYGGAYSGKEVGVVGRCLR